jgi:hypothetical protein
LLRKCISKSPHPPLLKGARGAILFIRRDGFGFLAMTISKSGFGVHFLLDDSMKVIVFFKSLKKEKNVRRFERIF